jgi:hypothetical protein
LKCSRQNDAMGWTSRRSRGWAWHFQEDRPRRARINSDEMNKIEGFLDRPKEAMAQINAQAIQKEI